MNILVTFESTHVAIALEKAVKDQGLKGRLVGTPERLSAACGLSLKTTADHLSAVQELIDLNGLRSDVTIYQIIEEKHHYSYQMLE